MTPRQARAYPDYDAALKKFLEEELAGETYYAGLAERLGGPARTPLLKIAEMERVTAAAFAPVFERRGLAWPDAEAMRQAGRRQADSEADRSWEDLLREMAEDYPVYLDEFAGVAALAPPEDAAFHQFLYAHEVAMIDFAKAARDGAADPLAPVEDFLRKAGG